MREIIERALEKTISYEEYRALIANLLEQGKVTGHTQSEDLVKYSELNTARMKRLDKTIVISDSNIEHLQNTTKKYTLLVLSEGWCGDAAQILPILNKLASASNAIALKIALRDENADLMNLFLTNGGKAIPKVIVLDKDNEVLASWGPRPEPARKLIADFKAANGFIDAAIKEEVQRWYLQDKGVTTQNEIIGLLN